MKRLILFTAIGASLVMAKKCESRSADGSGSRQPDVLFLMTDQWNPRCLPFEGEGSVITPNLARLAEEGIVFENCYTPSPVCIPARASLISGLYPHNHNIFGNLVRYYISPEMTHMFRDIRKAGYTTSQIGKHHWTEQNGWRDEFDSVDEYYAALGLDDCREIATPFTTPEGHGVYQDHLKEIGMLDDYCRDIARRVVEGQYSPRASVVKPEDHNDSFVADSAIDFIEHQSLDKPYCLVVSFPGPHPPLDAPGRYAEMVAPESVRLPPNVREDYMHMGRDSVREMRANYFGKMALIDDNVGRIIDVLKKRGTWDDTFVIFSSDHGEMMGAHGKHSKGRFFEESARVPLVMRWPGHIQPGRRTKALAQLFDIYPTIVEAIGGQLSSGHFAVSQLPVALGKTDSLRDAVFSEIGARPPLNYMVRTDRYVWWVHRGKEELYDMVTDPWQMNDLIDSPAHQEIITKLKLRHLQYFKDTQYNLSADYVPRLNRMMEEVGSEEEGLEERLYEMFLRNVGLK